MGTFGTSTNPGQFIELPSSADPTQTTRPPAGTVLKVRNSVTSAALTDITTGSFGYFAASFPGVDLIDVSVDGGTTWIGPLSSKETLNTLPSVATYATQAGQSAIDAQSAVAGVGDTVKAAVDNATTSISERVKNIEDGIDDGSIGGQAPGQVINFEWRFPASNLTAGAQGDPYLMRYDGKAGTIIGGPRIKLDAPGITDMTCDVQMNAVEGGTFSSGYTGNIAKLPAGQTVITGPIPQTTAINSGAEFSVTLPQVPPPPVAATTAASVPVSNKTNDLSTANQINLPVTIPGGTTGDTVLVLLQTNYDIDASKGLPSSAWSTIAANKSTDATTGGLGSHLAAQIDAAPWSATLSNTFLFKKTDGSNSTTPAVAIGLIIRGGTVASVAWGATAESSGAAATTPVTTVGAVACDFVIYGFAVRVNKIDADGGSQVFTGAATTIDQQVRTQRGATQAEQLLAVKVVALNPATTGAPGASIPTVTSTITGASASAANSSWLPFVILVKRTPGTTGPTTATVSIPVRIG